MIALTLGLYVLTVARITRLINFDAIFDKPRVAIVRFVRGNPVVVYFLTCPWCVSMWVAIALAWVPIYFADNAVAFYLMLALATSHLVGIGAPLSEDKELKIEGYEDAPDSDADNDD